MGIIAVFHMTELLVKFGLSTVNKEVSYLTSSQIMVNLPEAKTVTPSQIPRLNVVNLLALYMV